MKKIYKQFYKIRRKFFGDERKFLLDIMPKNSICAEIGVWKGDFSNQILQSINPKELHLIDPWKFQIGEDYTSACYGGQAGSQDVMDNIYNSVKERFNKEIKNGQVLIHRQSSFDLRKTFQDNYFDWVYIDGDHRYEAVKKDLESFYEMVKKDGYIAGDDYEKGGWWKGGVKKAVDEFIINKNVKKTKIKYKQFILQKI